MLKYGIMQPIADWRFHYDYDKRGRLTQETRTRDLSGDPEIVYDITYKYDDGGNRREKTDTVSQRRTVYHYDIDDPNLYGTNNNRLMYYEEFDTAPDPDELLTTTWYYYTPYGNVGRIVTRDENRAPTDPDYTAVRFRYARNGQTVSYMAGERWDEDANGDGCPDVYEDPGAGGPSACCLPPAQQGDDYTCTDVSTVGGPCDGGCTLAECKAAGGTYLIDNQFCVGDPCANGACCTGGGTCDDNEGNGITAQECDNQQGGFIPGGSCADDACGPIPLTWLREFRYDSPRQRYLVCEISPDAVGSPPLAAGTWTDYDGNDAYGDFEVTLNPTVMTDLRSYEPGLAEVDNWSAGGHADTHYLQTDHLGKTRQRSDDTPAAAGHAVFTAFGERISGPNRRHGYVGAHGYQAHDFPASDPVPFLHLGARYYDPASGRFLQRDPIGVAGGLNVYVYVLNRPTAGIDPTGNGFWNGDNAFHQWVADNFWRKIHSDETLAKMSDARAYAESIGGSVIGGVTIYFGSAYAIAGARGGLGRFGFGWSPGGTRFFGTFSFNSGRGWYYGSKGIPSTIHRLWGIPRRYFFIPTRFPGAASGFGGAGSGNCLSTMIWQWIKTL